MSLVLVTPTGSKTFPSGSVMNITPTFNGIGDIVGLTLELTYKGKPYRHECKSLADLYGAFTSLPA